MYWGRFWFPRFVPHDQHTEAFFIVVLQKVSDLPGNFFYDFSCVSLSNLGKEIQGILVDIGNSFSFKQSILKVVMKITVVFLAQGKSYVVTCNLMRIPLTLLLSKKGSSILSGGLKWWFLFSQVVLGITFGIWFKCTIFSF